MRHDIEGAGGCQNRAPGSRVLAGGPRKTDLKTNLLSYEGRAGGPDGGARCPDFMPRGRARAYPLVKAVGRRRWRLAAGRRTHTVKAV